MQGCPEPLQLWEGAEGGQGEAGVGGGGMSLHAG